jgi:hypothetical protein
MKLVAKKFVFVLTLSLVLLVLPIILGACSNSKGSSIDMGASFSLGSGGDPYLFDDASLASTCPSWGFRVPTISAENLWCVSTVPSALHSGDLVKLDGELLHVSSLDPVHHRVTLVEM